MSAKEFIKIATLAPDEEDKIEVMDIKGRLISNVLVNAQREIPGVGCTYDVDVTEFYKEFEKLKSDCGYKLTFNSLMMKVLVEGLKSAPRLNAHFQYNHTSTSGRLIIKKHIDVTMPVCLEGGETFQVKVSHLEDKTLEETANEIENVKEKLKNTNVKRVLFRVAGQRMVGYAIKGKAHSSFAQFFTAYFGKNKIAKFSKLFKKKYYSDPKKKKAPSLKVEDFTEGTVCFTNWGTLYENLNVNITYIPPLYPQVFMFGTGKIKKVQQVYKKADGTLDLNDRLVLPLTMVFDHKIGGAADLMPFIRKMDEIFNSPEVIHEW